MYDNRALHNNVGRLPVEVWENVIDMLYAGFSSEQVQLSRALHSCALVCRAWRTRSQRNLFYSVVLQSTEAVFKLAAVLGNGPHLSDYVHEVLIIAHTFHTTANTLSLFPIALHGKLPKLREFVVQHVAAGKKWDPTTPDSKTAKPLEHVPLHPRFPQFFSAFTAVNCLYINIITFRHFNDFLAIINALPALEDLACQRVHFMTLGPLPMYTKPQTDVDRPRARPFAPNLDVLGQVCHLQSMQHQYNSVCLDRCRRALHASTGISMRASSQTVIDIHAFHFGRTNGDLQWVYFVFTTIVNPDLIISPCRRVFHGHPNASRPQPMLDAAEFDYSPGSGARDRSVIT